MGNYLYKATNIETRAKQSPWKLFSVLAVDSGDTFSTYRMTK